MRFSRAGDEGYAELIGGERVAKDSPRMEALGDLDEAMSALGLARALGVREESKPLLVQLQRALFLLASEVAASAPEQLRQRLDGEAVTMVEAEIARLDGEVNRWAGFIVPGDSPGAGALDLARAIVRRAERHVVRLVHQGDVENVQLIRYLNRLSSLLYLLARADDRAAGVAQPTMMA